MNILIEKLKQLVVERRSEGTPDTVTLNALKEELHYVVLDFIYNSRAYCHLVMYGGTLLRIAYGLPRMSEDLDFQTDKKFDLQKFSEDLTTYFKTTYALEVQSKIKSERITGTDVAFINFPHILEEVGVQGHGIPTILKIRFDVNVFTHAKKFASEMIPITRDTYAFSIRTYPIGTLMASKMAAVFLRTKRGIGDKIADCKPRDIYDLMWYMGKKIVPDIEYLKASHERAGTPLEAGNVLEIFDALSRRVLQLDDTLFKEDLWRFFYTPAEYETWHRNWRQRFIQLRNSYELHKVKTLTEVFVTKEFSNKNRTFQYVFSTDEPGVSVTFSCTVTEYWYIFADIKIGPAHRRNDIKISTPNPSDLDRNYSGLFYTKIENYLKRNDHVVLQTELKTKIIVATAESFNVKTQIFLDRRLLETAHFEDLL